MGVNVLGESVSVESGLSWAKRKAVNKRQKRNVKNFIGEMEFEGIGMVCTCDVQGIVGTHDDVSQQ